MWVRRASSAVSANHRQGRLIVATFAGRSLMRIEKNGKRTVLADRYEGKRLNCPNDVVVKRDGAIYFTDTYGGFRLYSKDPRRELLSIPSSCGRAASSLSWSATCQ
jgi:sugar lactone lactonase YvrE